MLTEVRKTDKISQSNMLFLLATKVLKKSDITFSDVLHFHSNFKITNCFFD